MTRQALQRLATVVRLREAATQETRRALAARADQARHAGDAEAEALARRDAGEADWRERLVGAKCDPAVVALSATWLLQLEQSVAAARLETAIAVRREDEATEALAQATAGETAARRIHARSRKRLARKHEERQLERIGEAFLWKAAP